MTTDVFAHANGISWHVRALAILEVSSKLMYLPPEPGWESALSTSGSNHSSPAAMQQQQQPQQPQYQQGQMPMQTIDDFLRAQNFAAAAIGNGMGGGGRGGGAFGSFGGSAGAGGGGFGGSAGGGGGGLFGASGGSFDWEMDDPMSSYMPTGYGGSNGASPANVSARSRAWTRTARIRTPKAFEEVRSALLRLEADLAPDMRTNWEVWDGVCTVPVIPGSKKGGLSLVSMIIPAAASEPHVMMASRRGG